ncbi:MAG: hypothetical protein GC150_06365 [Rhizobiales bacterium]|nr:hypothetical protein [Hyphomicrobiales bacterium]
MGWLFRLLLVSGLALTGYQLATSWLAPDVGEPSAGSGSSGGDSLATVADEIDAALRAPRAFSGNAPLFAGPAPEPVEPPPLPARAPSKGSERSDLAQETFAPAPSGADGAAARQSRGLAAADGETRKAAIDEAEVQSEALDDATGLAHATTDHATGAGDARGHVTTTAAGQLSTPAPPPADEGRFTLAGLLSWFESGLTGAAPGDDADSTRREGPIGGQGTDRSNAVAEGESADTTTRGSATEVARARDVVESAVPPPPTPAAVASSSPRQPSLETTVEVPTRTPNEDPIAELIRRQTEAARRRAAEGTVLAETEATGAMPLPSQNRIRLARATGGQVVLRADGGSRREPAAGTTTLAKALETEDTLVRLPLAHLPVPAAEHRHQLALLGEPAADDLPDDGAYGDEEEAFLFADGDDARGLQGPGSRGPLREFDEENTRRLHEWEQIRRQRAAAEERRIAAALRRAGSGDDWQSAPAATVDRRTGEAARSLLADAEQPVSRPAARRSNISEGEARRIAAVRKAIAAREARKRAWGQRYGLGAVRAVRANQTQRAKRVRARRAWVTRVFTPRGDR